MSKKQLTPEQEALIPVYIEKWKNIALSTKPIDFDAAKEAVLNAWKLLGGKKFPEIVYYSSPYTVFNEVNADSWYNYIPNLLESTIIDSLTKEIYYRGYYHVCDCDLLSLSENLYEELTYILLDQFEFNIHRELTELFPDEVEIFYYHFEGQYLYDSTQLHKITKIAIIDFCIEVLNIKCDLEKWQILKTLILECGWIFTIENEQEDEYICVIVDRPTKISFDSNNRLHSEGSPAIAYSDGFKIYAYHGVTLPEKYGKIHPNEWQPEWLLTEENAELRRVLIEGIGYEKICIELVATEIDTWEEYTLLKIDKNLDVEPIYLLKMTCPSTNKIHALRVPPSTQSAREAIKWCNWDIDPEEFDIQT